MIPDFHLKQQKGGFRLPSDLNIAKKLLAKRPSDKKKLEVKESIWQGNIVSNRLDETVELSECFNWSNLHNLRTERNISANP